MPDREDEEKDLSGPTDNEDMDDEESDEDGSDDDDFEDDDDDIVVLEDADGNETEYRMMGLVEVDDESFALLNPAEEDDAADQMEVVLMRYDEDEDGGMIFSDIDDEPLFLRVQAAAEKFFHEMMEGDDEPSA